MTRFLTICFMIPLLSSCAYIERQIGLEEDNVLEEAAEFALKSQTGIDIDFTPGSPE